MLKSDINENNCYSLMLKYVLYETSVLFCSPDYLVWIVIKMMEMAIFYFINIYANSITQI